MTMQHVAKGITHQLSANAATAACMRRGAAQAAAEAGSKKADGAAASNKSLEAQVAQLTKQVGVVGVRQSQVLVNGTWTSQWPASTGPEPSLDVSSKTAGCH